MWLLSVTKILGEFSLRDRRPPAGPLTQAIPALPDPGTGPIQPPPGGPLGGGQPRPDRNAAPRETADEDGDLDSSSTAKATSPR